MYKANPRVNDQLRHRLPSLQQSNATQQHSNATLQHSNATQQHSNTTLQHSNATQQHSNATLQHSNTTLQHSNATQQHSNTTLQHKTASPQSNTPGTSQSSQLLTEPPDRPYVSLHLQAPQEQPASRSASPLSPRPALDSASRLSSPLPLTPYRMEVDGLLPRADISTDRGQGAGGRRGLTSPVNRHLVDNNNGSERQADLVLDRDKNISFLLKELDSLRDLNKKLHAQLVQKEKELERREVEEELREAQLEARDWERPGAVLEEIYAAQREREQAVMARLLLANEERDQALLRAKRLQQAASELENINSEESDMDIEDLLRCVCGADSAQAVESLGLVLVERVQKARQRRAQITSQEMNALIEERDRSVAKMRCLEVREQDQTTANSRLIPAEHQEELERLQKERDVALEHSHRLEEELQTLRANHSLHPSQPGSSPASPTQNLQSSQDSQPSLPRHGASLLGMTAQQPLLLQLQRSQEAERAAWDKIQKLERLVEVLRKKVGTGSVRAVI
ncbi:mirror-image polydactyly gene 1 protein [Polymixia lowei]